MGINKNRTHFVSKKIAASKSGLEFSVAVRSNTGPGPDTTVGGREGLTCGKLL